MASGVQPEAENASPQAEAPAQGVCGLIVVLAVSFMAGLIMAVIVNWLGYPEQLP